MTDLLTNNDDEVILNQYCQTSEESKYVDIFYHGIYYLYENNLDEANKNICFSVNHIIQINGDYFEYSSYLGLVEVLFSQKNGGLHRCYEALKHHSNKPELYINIAFAELSLGNRRRAILAIENCLQHNPRYSYAQRIKDCIGERKVTKSKKPNQRKSIVGKLLRKKQNQSLLDKTVARVFKEIIASKLELYVQQKRECP